MRHNIPQWLEIAWACASILASLGGVVMMVIWLRDRRELRKIAALIERIAGGPVKRPEKAVELPTVEDEVDLEANLLGNCHGCLGSAHHCYGGGCRCRQCN